MSYQCHYINLLLIILLAGPLPIKARIFSKDPFTLKRQHQCCDVTSDVTKIVIYQVNCSKNWFRPQLIRYDPNVDTEAPTKPLTLSVHGA